MEGGDNVGVANNDVGGGASSSAAADPSTPSDGATAAAGGGGVVDNSSPVVEDGNGLTATTQTIHSENGTPVTVKIVKTAAGNRAKRSWIWQLSGARVQAFHQREKRDLLGLQTLGELGFKKRNDRHDTALREKAPYTLRADHEEAHHSL